MPQTRTRAFRTRLCTRRHRRPIVRHKRGRNIWTPWKRASHKQRDEHIKTFPADSGDQHTSTAHEVSWETLSPSDELEQILSHLRCANNFHGRRSRPACASACCCSCSCPCPCSCSGPDQEAPRLYSAVPAVHHSAHRRACVGRFRQSKFIVQQLIP